MIYSHRVKIIDSRISMGPVADMILSGCPENNANSPPHIAPDNIHSIVAFVLNL